MIGEALTLALVAIACFVVAGLGLDASVAADWCVCMALFAGVIGLVAVGLLTPLGGSA